MHKVELNCPEIYKWKGTWEGTFRYVDPSLQLKEQRRSRISYDFPENGPHDMVQHVEWWFDDGRHVELHNHGKLVGDRFRFSLPTALGEAWQVDHNIVLMYVKREDLGKDIEYQELITLSADNNSRARTIHWYQAGEMYQITFIDERRIA